MELGPSNENDFIMEQLKFAVVPVVISTWKGLKPLKLLSKLSNGQLFTQMLILENLLGLKSKETNVNFMLLLEAMRESM
ncbi:LOW QUALITY PROTEIN: hypothetical protein ACHAXS_000890 [Conticribra weissflogii]